MAQQTINVDRLLGQARNPVQGQVSVGVLPYRVFNLVPNRMGGYVPFGRRAEVLIGGSQVFLSHVVRMVGFDETGVSSYRVGSPTGDFQLYWGSTLTQRTIPVAVSAAEESAVVHLDAAGAYVTRKNYFVFEQQNPSRNYRIAVEPIGGALTTSAPADGPAFENGAVDGVNAPEVDLAFGGDAFVLAARDRIVRRTTTNTSWETVWTAGSGRYVRRVKYANGQFFALVTNLSYQSGAIIISSDSGQTWGSEIALPDSARFMYGLGYLGGGAWAALGNTIDVSTDGGVSWVRRDELSGAQWEVYDGAYSPVRGVTLAPVFRNRADLGSNSLHTMLTTNTGTSWVTMDMQHGGTLIHPNSMIRRGAFRTVAFPDGEYLFIHLHGEATRATYAGGVGYSYHVMSNATPVTGFGGPGAAGTVHGVAYDAATDLVIVVGETGDHEPVVAHSSDRGSSWMRMPGIEAAFYQVVQAVAVDSNGHAMYIGDSQAVPNNLYVYTSNASGLTAGSYNIYTVAYFNTHAGRFVFDMAGRVETVEATGGQISIRLPSQASIRAANPWINLVPANWPLLEDIRCDVYIQRAADNIEGEEVRYTIRYAFTEPYPATDPLERVIESLPLGQQLLVDGLPTTAIFEKSRTALHNGRVWGMVSQDETLWGLQGDEMSMEIANQANRFVLGYTEIGWANLMSDRSYIPIQPTQSTEFTGIISTPSGLLVMFENEIFLINGDPAFGNVSVELYLDMVGCDEGTEPCKVGGVPFTIWNGKVWVLQAGQAQQIGAEQWRADDPFIRIAPEPQTRSILALTRSGQVFRYVLDDQFWFTDAVTTGDPVIEMLPNCSCGAGLNTRFVVQRPAAGGGWEYPVFATKPRTAGETPDAPHVAYLGMDFGALERRKALYVVKAGFEGPLMQAEYDRSAGGFDANAIPALIFEAANEVNGSVDSVAPQAGGLVPYKRASGTNVNGTLAWRLPLGRTRGDSIDVRLELRGMSYDDALKLPLRFVVAAGGELR